LIMYAAAPGRVALDGEGDNSPFTEALLKELREPGVSALNAFFNTSDRVIAATGNLQEPWVKFDGSGRAFRKLSFQGSSRFQWRKRKPRYLPRPLRRNQRYRNLRRSLR
jgi:uncharacterized caspase-like protein